MRLAHPMCLILAAAVVLPAHATPLPSPNRVTILYDAVGSRDGLTRDWGFAALVEYNGKRILFDTGNNADVFAKNVRALGVDLRTVDFVVISHRHGDHTAGLNYLLTVNPGVKIYAPKEALGFLERHCLGRSIAPIPRCRAACGTSTAIRRPNSPSVRLGRQLISSGWTASPRSPQAYPSFLPSPRSRARWSCGSSP